VSALSAGAAGSAAEDGAASLPDPDGRHPAGTPLAWIDP
jgi:hypothetical protein